MLDPVKVLFQFEDTPAARRTLAAAMQDTSWEDHQKHPTLELGFGMVEHSALFVLTQISQQYGARLLVVAAPKVLVSNEVSVQENPKPAPIKRVAMMRKEEK